MTADVLLVLLTLYRPIKIALRPSVLCIYYFQKLADLVLKVGVCQLQFRRPSLLPSSGSGERCELPGGVRAGAPAAKAILIVFTVRL